METENNDYRPETCAELKARAIAIMKAKPGDCDTYVLLNSQAHWIIRAPEASMEELNDLFFQLYEIHRVHCPEKRKYAYSP